MAELIAFYSRAGENYINGSIKKLSVGNTEVVAAILQEITKADLFKIEPYTPYSKDYSECINQAMCDQQRNARPELVQYPEHIEQYEKLYLGFPNYWGTMPMPVFTFLEKCRFCGKRIVLFCTHEGDGFGRSKEDIAHIYPNIEVECGPAIRGVCISDAEKILTNWLKSSYSSKGTSEK